MGISNLNDISDLKDETIIERLSVEESICQEVVPVVFDREQEMHVIWEESKSDIKDTTWNQTVNKEMNATQISKNSSQFNQLIQFFDKS